ATLTALRPVLHQRSPMPAVPGSYAPRTVTCDWIALAVRLGRAAFGFRLAAVRPLAVASWLSGFALPPGCVARWPLLPAASLRLALFAVWPAFAPAPVHTGRRGRAA